MAMLKFLTLALVAQRWTLFANAHIVAWHKGMYCLNGTKPGVENLDTNEATQPMYKMNRTDWWFHHVNKCDEFPPAPGDFLELPANGNFTVELALNRAHTSLSYNGAKAGVFPDGQNHTGLGTTMDGKLTPEACISLPNIHTQNETMAAGTIFAISYVSEMSKVTPENLAVFSVRKHTPWKRETTYDVPDLPACPPEGCICAWGWVANGCGIPNMYMMGYRCRVTGKAGTAPVAPAAPPVWCEDDQSKCVKGAKQMIYWHQLEGNNVNVDGFNLAGEPKSPTYNERMGFRDGAQHDIFVQKTASLLPRSPRKHHSASLTHRQERLGQN